MRDPGIGRREAEGSPQGVNGWREVVVLAMKQAGKLPKTRVSGMSTESWSQQRKAGILPPLPERLKCGVESAICGDAARCRA